MNTVTSEASLWEMFKDHEVQNIVGDLVIKYEISERDAQQFVAIVKKLGSYPEVRHSIISLEYEDDGSCKISFEEYHDTWSIVQE